MSYYVVFDSDEYSVFVDRRLWHRRWHLRYRASGKEQWIKLPAELFQLVARELKTERKLSPPTREALHAFTREVIDAGQPSRGEGKRYVLPKLAIGCGLLLIVGALVSGIVLLFEDDTTPESVEDEVGALVETPAKTVEPRLRALNAVESYMRTPGADVSTDFIKNCEASQSGENWGVSCKMEVSPSGNRRPGWHFSVNGSTFEVEPDPFTKKEMFATQTPLATPREPLALLSLICERSSSSYMEARGEVKNVSGRRLEDVKALVTWRTAAGTFIDSDDALIDLTVLLPGQASPFSVISNYNPAVTDCSVRFTTLFGEPIAARDDT